MKPANVNAACHSWVVIATVDAGLPEFDDLFVSVFVGGGKFSLSSKPGLVCWPVFKASLNVIEDGVISFRVQLIHVEQAAEVHVPTKRSTHQRLPSPRWAPHDQ